MKNISSDNVVCSDVRDLDFATLGGIDALAFGFPCNDFSVVGKRAGSQVQTRARRNGKS